MPGDPQALQDRMTAARARLGRLRPQVDPEPDPQEPTPVPKPSGGWRSYIPAAIRGVGGLISGIASDEPGLGTAIGAGVGGAAEALAEKVGGEEYSPARIAAEAGIGAVPFGGLRKLFGGGRILSNVAAGATMAGGGELARDQAVDGLHVPTSDELRGAGKSALIGGGTAGVLGGLLGRTPATPELEVDRYMPNVGGNESAYRADAEIPARTQYGRPQAADPLLDSEADLHRASFDVGGPGLAPGGRTQDPLVTPPAPRAFGRLTPRSTPTVNETLQSALDDLRNPQPDSVELGLSHPEGGEAITGPMSRADEGLTHIGNTADTAALLADLDREGGRTPENPLPFLGRALRPEPELSTDPNGIALERLRTGGDEFDQSHLPPFAETDPERLLPPFGATSETTAGQRLGIGGSKTRILRPESSTLDLANELAASELGPGAKVTGLKSYLRPSGSDALSKALRQRAHIAENQMGRFGNESGSVDPELLSSVAVHGAGAAAGGVLGAATDPEDRQRGAVLGALGGAGVVAGVRNPAAAERLRFFSMLSSPLTHVKNIAGNVGSLATESAVKALSGDGEGARKLVSAPFRDGARTAQVARDAFNAPQVGEENRIGLPTAVSGVLSLPGRAIGAVDAVTRDILERGGLDPERAAKGTYSNEPESTFAQGILGLQRKSRLFRQAVPFAKTPLNIAERGVEHSPFAFFLPSAKKALMGEMGQDAQREAIARIGLGTAAAGAAYATGANNPYAAAVAGPMALPVSLAGEVGAAPDTTAPDSAIERGVRAAARAIPGMAPEIPGLQSYFASFVPNAARMAAEGLDPADDRSPVGYFGEAAKRVPILRESLPQKSAGGGRTRSAAKNRRARR